MNALLPVLGLAAALAAPAAGAGDEEAADGGPAQELRLEVAVPGEVTFAWVRAEVERVDGPRTVGLVDDGTAGDALAWDGVWTAVVRGPWSRFTAVRLVAGDPTGEETVLYEGLVRTEDRCRAHAGWRVVLRPGGPVALRTPVALPGEAGTTAEALPLVAAFGWGLAAIALVGWLARPPRGDAP